MPGHETYSLETTIKAAKEYQVQLSARRDNIVFYPAGSAQRQWGWRAAALESNIRTLMTGEERHEKIDSGDGAVI